MASFVSSERYQYIVLVGLILCFVGTFYVISTSTQVVALTPTYKGITNTTTAVVTDQSSKLVSSGPLKRYIIKCLIKPTAGSAPTVFSVVPVDGFDATKIVSQTLNLTSSPDGSTTATPLNVFNQVIMASADTITITFLSNSTNNHTMTLDLCTQ